MLANEADTYFKQICDENNVRYIDGNLIKNEILNVSDDDFSDWEGHMNGELAEQFSEVLTEILKRMIVQNIFTAVMMSA